MKLKIPFSKNGYPGIRKFQRIPCICVGATFDASAIATTTAFANRAVSVITEVVNDNETDGNTIELGNVAKNANDTACDIDDADGGVNNADHIASEADDAGHTVANNDTDGIRSYLISKSKLFSDKEELYKPLGPGANILKAMKHFVFLHSGYLSVFVLSETKVYVWCKFYIYSPQVSILDLGIRSTLFFL
ncbi:unnamed protein product [Mucor hiemalis]